MACGNHLHVPFSWALLVIVVVGPGGADCEPSVTATNGAFHKTSGSYDPLLWMVAPIYAGFLLGYISVHAIIPLQTLSKHPAISEDMQLGKLLLFRIPVYGI